eukprot:scaffold24640_cov68-Cyclotella_meneghiniana.AAC.5
MQRLFQYVWSTTVDEDVSVDNSDHASQEQVHDEEEADHEIPAVAEDDAAVQSIAAELDTVNDDGGDNEQEVGCDTSEPSAGEVVSDDNEDAVINGDSSEIIVNEEEDNAAYDPGDILISTSEQAENHTVTMEQQSTDQAVNDDDDSPITNNENDAVVNHDDNQQLLDTTTETAIEKQRQQTAHVVIETENVFEQITDDLVIPTTTPTDDGTAHSQSFIQQQQQNEEEEEHTTATSSIQQQDDVYPKAHNFLITNQQDEEEVTVISNNEAIQIIEFDENNVNDDGHTVLTSKTTATSISRGRITTLRPSGPSTGNQQEDDYNEYTMTIDTEHQSLFDILDRNFMELGDNPNSGLSYDDVQLCFAAFVIVFAPISGISERTIGDSTTATVNDGMKEGESVDEEQDEEQAKQQPQQSSPKIKVARPNVPLSFAFALWKKVLQCKGHNQENNVTATTLSYIRSSLVLLGLLELSTIDSEDTAVVPIIAATNNRRHAPKSSPSIECLRLHHDINEQYGHYLAYNSSSNGNDDTLSFRSIIKSYQHQWNDAVRQQAISSMTSYNEYTLQMLPAHTMRSYRIQDTFDILKEKSFVRRRYRLWGASEAAVSYVRDVDELLRWIDKRHVMVNEGSLSEEMVDEHMGVLNAFDQFKKYCLHVVDELMKHNAVPENDEEKDDDDNDESKTEAAINVDNTTLSKIRDVGKALHLLGNSLGGYGFFDQEMNYYTDALRLKQFCRRSQADHVSISDTLHCMGFSLDNASKSEEALEYYDRALDIRYEYLGEDDLRVAETLHNKGALLCDEETSEEAMECLEEALRIRELHYGEEHESCADTMQWMGNLLRQYGDPSDALDYFKFALRIKQIRLGADHIDVANTLFNTAVLLDDVEKYDLSLIAYKEACRIRKLVLGTKSSDVADTLFCLGNVATAMEKHQEALDYFNEAIEILEELIKYDDMYADENDDSLLFISRPHSIKPGLLTQYQKLNKCLEEVLPLTKLLVGSNHQDVCKLLNRMGGVYKKLHDWDNAIGSFQGALRVKRADEEIDRDDIEVATLLQKKGEGRNHQCLNESSKALEKYLSSLQQCKLNKQNVDYRIVVMLLHTIGQIYEGEKVNQQDMAMKCKTH